MLRSLRLKGVGLAIRSAGLIAAALPLPLLAIEPTDLERAFLAERRSINQLHLEMETDRMSYGVQLTRTKRTIWQDGENRRCDEIREYLDGKGVTEVPPHRFVHIETPQYLVFWNGRPQPKPFRLCAHFDVPTRKKLMALGSPVHDVRSIGLGLTVHPREKPWDWLIAAPERTAAASVEAKGDQVTVTFQRPNNATIEQVYEKRGDKHLLRRLTGRDEKHENWTTMECSYPATLVGGCAFPDSIECKHVSDKTVITHEKSTIRLKSINEAIPRSRFSIVTTELPAGTPVIGDAIPPELLKPFHHIEWNGEALVPVSNSEIMLEGDRLPRFGEDRPRF